MNIFILDMNHQRNAEFHNDRHVVKMILEHVQMLSTCLRHYAGVDTLVELPDGRPKVINLLPGETYKIVGESVEYDTRLAYSSTHYNHPCNIWLRESQSNFKFLMDLTEALNTEKMYRFGPTFEQYLIDVEQWRASKPQEFDNWVLEYFKSNPQPITEEVLKDWYRIDHTHKSWELAKSFKVPDYKDIGLTQFAQAMPDECRVENDAVQAYRNYYTAEKGHLAQWSKRPIPYWYGK